VFNPDAPSSKRALEEFKRDGVRIRAIQYAHRRTRSAADAEDLVQAALERVFDPDGSPWDPDGGKTFFAHMLSVINGLHMNRVRAAQRRREVIDSALVEEAAPATDVLPADEALESHEALVRLRRLGEKLRERLKGDVLALEVLDLAIDGYEQPAAQAAQLGCPLTTVREANRRLKYQAARLLEEERASGRASGENGGILEETAARSNRGREAP
jgi:DNA-directed RNA polymerase specialized sigma24 family protein